MIITSLEHRFNNYATHLAIFESLNVLHLSFSADNITPDVSWDDKAILENSENIETNEIHPEEEIFQGLTDSPKSKPIPLQSSLK